MLLWIFRTIFIIVILAVLFFNISSPSVSADQRSFHIILWSGLALALAAFFMDILTPKKSLTALAGVFFGLLVGMFFSWALVPIVDFINGIYKLGLSAIAIQAIKGMMGICICYLIISIVMRTKDDNWKLGTRVRTDTVDESYVNQPARRINEIVHGKRRVTPDTALRLARYFDMSPEFWLGLQMDYDLDVAEDKSADLIRQEVRVFAGP